MINPDSIEHNLFHSLSYSFDLSSLRQGIVLISDPFMQDPNFSRTVILITDYNAETGAMGFVINKPTDCEVNEIIADFNGNGYLFHAGGPVSSDGLFFLHHTSLHILDSVKITDELAWTANFEEVNELHKNGKLPPTDIKILGGYSGWGVGQLEQEIEDKSWIISELSADRVLTTGKDSLWKQSLKKLGSKFSIMADFPENPNMN